MYPIPFMFYLTATSEDQQTELSLPHEVRQDIHGQGEDDGGVLLRCDGVESLQVAKLQG